jgi:predicted transcriptional regulator
MVSSKKVRSGNSALLHVEAATPPILNLQNLIKEIKKQEPELEPAKALRKHVVKISIYNLLQEENPKSILEISRKIGVTERQAWKHIKELREWGILPSDFHSKKA